MGSRTRRSSRCLRGRTDAWVALSAEAPVSRGAARVLLVLRKNQNQVQRRRTEVSDPHSQFRVPGDSHRFIFFDVQVTLLPVLGWGYWIYGGFCGDLNLRNSRFLTR